MSELQFLGALEVELLRHRELGHDHPAHEALQVSTLRALLGGAFDGDVTLDELLEHGELGLGTLNGLDGELIVIDGAAWKADVDCRLVRPPGSAQTPYAVVVPFVAGEPAELTGPREPPELEAELRLRLPDPNRPTAVRIDGRFARMEVRSVPRQRRPYPPLAEAIAQQHVHQLGATSGSMVGFCFPDPLHGIELLGWHLHFASDDRQRGGHVLSYTLSEGIVCLDQLTELHVELPPTVEIEAGAEVDQATLRRLESD